MNAQVHTAASGRITIHFYSYKSCVKMLTRNESNLPAEHRRIHKSTSSKSRKGQPFILNHTSYAQILTIVTHLLSTSECTSSHSSKWRKEQPFIPNHTSCVRMLTKYESNLPTEHKWMHKFTQQTKWRKEQLFIFTCICTWTKYEINLPPEHKWMHKFTQQQVEERITIHS